MRRPFLLTLTLILIIALIALFSGNMRIAFLQSDDHFNIDQNVSVSKIILTSSADEQVTLERIGDNEWVLNYIHAANKVAVNQLITTLRRLTVQRPVSIGNRQGVNEHLQRDGTTVEVYKRRFWLNIPFFGSLLPGHRLIRKFVIGDEVEGGQANYMRMYGSDNPYIVYLPGMSTAFHGLFSPEEAQWHDPLVIDLRAHQIQKIEVRVPESPKESFTISRDDMAGFSMFDDQGNEIDRSSLDTVRLDRYVHSFSELAYYSLLTGERKVTAKPERILPPFMEIEVWSTTGEYTHLICYYRPNRRQEGRLYAEGLVTDPNLFYMTINEEKFAAAEFYIFSRILRHRSYFLNDDSNSLMNAGKE